jgi:hypothetical protein
MGWTSHWIVPSKRRAQPPFVFPAVCRRDLRHPLHNYSSCDLRHPRHKCLTDAAIIIHHYGANAQETARLNWIVAAASMFKYPCCHGPVARPPAHVDNSTSLAPASTLLAIHCRFSFPLCFLYSLLKFVDLSGCSSVGNLLTVLPLLIGLVFLDPDLVGFCVLVLQAKHGKAIITWTSVAPCIGKKSVSSYS